MDTDLSADNPPSTLQGEDFPLHLDWQGIDTWLFDLDNTLYPEDSGLFRMILGHMADYVAEVKGVDLATALNIQSRLFRQYGTTLKGLMVENDIDPEHYTNVVHDVDLSELQPSERVVEFFKHCPGQKIIFTNGTMYHAERILDALGLSDHIDGIHDIAATDYRPKPDPMSYQSVIDRFGFDAGRSIFFEDSWTNLQAAKRHDIKTVFLHHGRRLPQEMLNERPDWVVGHIEEAMIHLHENVIDIDK